MCNINIIYNKKENNKVISSLMNTLSFNSFQNNKDGEGYIMVNNNLITTNKSKSKFIYKSKCNLLVTHQRKATSGNNKFMIHPHRSKNFILLHNGVFYGKGNTKKSDTRVYFDSLNKNYEKYKNTIKAIQKTNKKIAGYYSIVLYDIRANKFYYYKEDISQIYKIEDENYLILSTVKENCEYAKRFLNIKGNITSVKPFMIYDLLTFKLLAKFKEKKYKFVDDTRHYNGFEYTWYKQPNYNINSKEDFDTDYKDTSINEYL